MVNGGAPRVQFSIASVLVTVVAVAAVLRLTMAVGVALTLFGALIIAAYVAGRLLRRRYCLAGLAIAVTFAVAPWTGVGGYSLGYPAARPMHALLDISRNDTVVSLVTLAAGPVYALAKLPLEAMGGWNRDINGLLFFPRSGRIRPFAVFYIWSSVAVVLAVASSLGRKRGRKRGRTSFSNPE